MSSLRSLPVTPEHPAGALHYRDAQHRVVLRPLALADADPIALAIEESLPELRRFMMWAHEPQTAIVQLARIKTSLAEYHVGRSLQMGLFQEESGELLTICGMEKRVPLNPNGWEIGYWTPTSKTKRGYATLATQLLTSYAFDLLGADRVQLLVDEANSASARVVAKCGFIEEARLTHATTRPSPELLARGYRPSPRCTLSALWPEAYGRLSWPVHLRRHLEVKNLLGYRVTGFWS